MQKRLTANLWITDLTVAMQMTVATLMLMTVATQIHMICVMLQTRQTAAQQVGRSL